MILLLLIPISSSAGLFGYPEKQYPTNAKMFPKWESMLQRALRAGPNGPNCTPSPAKKCYFAILNKLATRLSEFKPKDQLTFVHRFVNKMKYVADKDNYGKSDYWATQHQTYGIASGDCEDYAIAKYYALKLLGFNPQDMRVVIVQDTNIDLAHAILVVKTGQGNLVLDNRLKSMVKDTHLHHLEPIFAINENAWWRYTRRKNR